MCGRFSFASTKIIIDEEFGTDTADDIAPRYNCAPSQLLAVITHDAVRKISLFRWGLIPGFLYGKTETGFINARAETITQKPSFRNAFRRQRCLVPADSFYEWSASGKKKNPWRIAVSGRSLFGMAGIYDSFSTADGTLIHSFAIVTVASSADMKNLHDRMPVILQKSDYQMWLQGEPESATALLKPYEGHLTLQRVSEEVNLPKNDHPGLHTPLTLI